MPSPVASEESGGPPQPAVRIYYLDWLRVLSILMVFLFHAVHPFDFGDWQVKNTDQSEILTIVLLFLSMWGMPFFFVLAGAGSWLALQRRTARQYVSERFYRLFIPFVAGSILFTPIEYYCENMNKIQRGVLTSFPGFLSAFTIFRPSTVSRYSSRNSTARSLLGLALLMAAAARKYNLFLCVQDLTCPGASLIHSAGLAAHVPGVAAIEANARQFVPAANAGWTDRFPGIFVIKDGMMRTGTLTGPGLSAKP